MSPLSSHCRRLEIGKAKTISAPPGASVRPGDGAQAFANRPALLLKLEDKTCVVHLILETFAVRASASTDSSRCSKTIISAPRTIPPFDLIKVDDNRYRIEMAVAGFARDEIEIVSQQNQLQIRGQKGDNDESNYVHRGIATRSFERRFALADHMQVRGADLKDGMLAIELVREIPEAMKPRKIEIGSSDAQQIEGKVAETEEA